MSGVASWVCVRPILMMSCQASALSLSALRSLAAPAAVRCSISFRAGDVHGRRIGVVRRLAHVAVIVGMHRRLASPVHRPASRSRGSRSPRWRSCSTAYRNRSARRPAESALSSLPSITSFAAAADDVPCRSVHRRACPSPYWLSAAGALDDAERTDDGQPAESPSRF